MAGGQPTKYNPDFHPEEIIRLMKDYGKTAVQVARDWDIDVETLNEWQRVHKEFSVASKRAKQFRRAWWIDKGHQGMFTVGDVKFDSRLYGMMMRYDGMNLDERVVPLPELANCKTFSEQATCILGAVASGRITVKEAQGYISIVGMAAKVEEVTELKRLLTEIQESRNAG